MRWASVSSAQITAKKHITPILVKMALTVGHKGHKGENKIKSLKRTNRRHTTAFVKTENTDLQCMASSWAIALVKYRSNVKSSVNAIKAPLFLSIVLKNLRNSI